MKTALAIAVSIFLFVAFGVSRANATLCVSHDPVREVCPIMFSRFTEIVEDVKIQVADNYEVFGGRFPDGTFTSLDQSKKTFADKKAAHLDTSVEKQKTAETFPVGDESVLAVTAYPRNIASWYSYLSEEEIPKYVENPADGAISNYHAQAIFRTGRCVISFGGRTDFEAEEKFHSITERDSLKYSKNYLITNKHPGFDHGKQLLIEKLIAKGKDIESAIRDWCGGEPQKPVKNLVIDSFAPDSIMAGKGILNPLSGFVRYETLAKPFIIEGKNLQGLTMSADNLGLDGEPGITFSDIQVSGDGTVATGYIKSRGAATNGQTVVTMGNGAGRSVTREMMVDITGTQYLKRTFGETVLFLGDWTDAVPNAHITDLENGLKDGLKYIWAIGYLKLRILPTIYEEGVWNLAACPPDTQITAISGCASPGNKIIHLRDNPEEITPTIFHEAVHKLDYWHRGQYRGTPGAPMSPDGFFRSWVEAAARPEGYPPCQFLPLQNNVTWKDGTNEVPHCGFIVAYGASDRGTGEYVMAVGARENPANLVGFYEDVATMAESHIFSPGLFNLPEASADTRYNKKVNLLRQYVFFP